MNRLILIYRMRSDITLYKYGVNMLRYRNGYKDSHKKLLKKDLLMFMMDNNYLRILYSHYCILYELQRTAVKLQRSKLIA